jgi:prepilin-type processing-associated H-X9-DG protein
MRESFAGWKKIYASTGRGGTVVVVDANTYEVLNTIPVGKRPWGITFSPDGKYLFTANGPSDDVSVVDLATEKEIARVKSPGSPWGIVAVPDDWPSLLDPYLKNSKIHFCPSDLVSTNNSYGLNELGFVDLTDPGVTTPNRLAGFHTPTATVMLGDVGTEDDFKTVRPDTLKLIAPDSDLNDDKDARPGARHNQRCDLGFMDGHAEPLRLNQFYLNQNPSNKWFTP